jgi:hypothetical protein
MSVVRKLFVALPGKKLDPRFSAMLTEPGAAPGIDAAEEVFTRMPEPDGNFAEQLATTGFDARLWELYLFAALEEQGKAIERPSPSPDFVLRDPGLGEAWVEAVTTNPATPVRDRSDWAAVPKPPTPEELAGLRDNDPRKLGRALQAKLAKRYWESQPNGGPLAFAVAPFHDDWAFTTSSVSLMRQLFGSLYTADAADAQVLVDAGILDPQSNKAGTVERGFFESPQSEHVSAVLFSNGGTWAKFSRRGVQTGRYRGRIKQWRVGTFADPNPSAIAPKMVRYEVGENGYVEEWSEGLSVFHNPRASVPLDQMWFPRMTHHRLEEGRIVSDIIDPLPLQTRTITTVLT